MSAKCGGGNPSGCHADRIEIRVEESGPGVSEALFVRIFDPFFTTDDADSGMGAGPSIVHDIIREHDGKIAVSRSPPGSASFCVQRPRWISSPRPESPA
jgi:signal transduction histidine kinase